MRAVLLYFATIITVIWMASDGEFDRAHLPITSSRAPTHISNLPLPDPHDLNSLSVVPAAQADTFTSDLVYVQGAIVNLRSGPGLSYRMIDVLQSGDEVQIEGRWRGDWAPILDPVTGLRGWMHGEYLTSRPPQ
ncbi:MAG: SH3 domain-containing protein [Pseudomonadota bacterium]